MPAPAPDFVNTLPRATRDPALDLIRGLAISILVVNHLPFDSALEDATSGVLSAAEMLVCVSGVVAGMVFGRRWLTLGARRTSRMLLARARKLYLAAVVVVSVFGLLTLAPWLATDAMVVSRGVDHYAFESMPDAAWAILSLQAGPWQFNILGLFIAVLALTPALLWALARGWWPAVLIASLGLYTAGRAWNVDLLPSQSEQPFPFLVWQLLYVGGVLVGWHREQIAVAAERSGRTGFAVIAVLAATAVVARLTLDERFFGKDQLDPARIVAMVSIMSVLYLVLRRHEITAKRVTGWLQPLGRNSFYVYIMQTFVCLGAASLPALSGEGFGRAGNIVVQLGCLALLWLMVQRRFLFRWVPR